MSGAPAEPLTRPVRERKARPRLHLTLDELADVEAARSSLTRTLGRVPTLTQAVVYLSRRRLEELNAAPGIRPLRRIEVPSAH